MSVASLSSFSLSKTKHYSLVLATFLAAISLGSTFFLREKTTPEWVLITLLLIVSLGLLSYYFKSETETFFIKQTAYKPNTDEKRDFFRNKKKSYETVSKKYSDYLIPSSQDISLLKPIEKEPFIEPIIENIIPIIDKTEPIISKGEEFFLEKMEYSFQNKQFHSKTNNELDDLLKVARDESKTQSQRQNAYERAMSLHQNLVNEDVSETAAMLRELAVIYINTHQKEKGQAYYFQALKLYENLLAKNTAYLKDTIDVLREIQEIPCHSEIIKTYYTKIFDVCEKLTVKEPEIYLSQLALILENWGNFYRLQNEDVKACSMYERALRKREELVEKNTEQFLPDLAQSLCRLAQFYTEIHDFEKADTIYARVVKMYDGLLQKDQEKYKDARLEIGEIAIRNALLGGFYEKMEHYCQKLIDQKSSFRIYSYLAISLILQLRWAEARTIYVEKKSLIYNNNPLKVIFLNDLKELKSAGFKNRNFHRVERLLK